MFKWLHYSPETLEIQKEKLFTPLIIIFEKRVREIYKKFSDQARKDEMAKAFKKSITEKTTFEDNVNEFLKKFYPRSQSIDQMTLEKMEDDMIPEMNEYKSNMDDSFQEQTGQPMAPIPKLAQLPLNNKKVVVPMLQLPTSNNRDSNPTIISRSTRRHELLNKSSVSTSNRLAQQWGAEGGLIHYSREPSLRDRRVSVGPHNDANMSYLDDQSEAYFVVPQTSLPVVSFCDAARWSLRKRYSCKPGSQDGRILLVRRSWLPA